MPPQPEQRTRLTDELACETTELKSSARTKWQDPESGGLQNSVDGLQRSYSLLSVRSPARQRSAQLGYPAGPAQITVYYEGTARLRQNYRQVRTGGALLPSSEPNRSHQTNDSRRPPSHKRLVRKDR